MPETSERNTAPYFLLLVLACLMFAGQGTAIKYLGRQLGPIQITFLPFTTATILMLPLLVRARRASRSPIRLTSADWGRFIVAGVGGQVVAQLGVVAGITRSLASNAAILGLMLPVISTVLATFMLHERLTRLRVAALAIGLAGVLLLSGESLRQSSFLETRYLVGNLLILVGMGGSAFYNVYSKGLFARFQQIEVLVFSYIAASAVGLVVVAWVDPFHAEVFAPFTRQSWVAFAYQALITYSVAMLLFFAALKRLDVSTASLALYMLPVFGVILAALLLGERLSAMAICGAAIVLIATMLIVKFDKPA